MTSDTGETNRMNPHLNRREFIAQALGAAALAATASTAMAGMVRSKNSLPKSPTKKVALGKSGVQVSLVGMGTQANRRCDRVPESLISCQNRWEGPTLRPSPSPFRLAKKSVLASRCCIAFTEREWRPSDG